MEDFFDNFDWEDMAMIGGMAEEFAEEERDRRRSKRKSYRDPEGEFDFDNGFRRRPEKSRYSRKTPRRKPFEQYAHDVACGRKHHHDPLFGPAKRRRGMSRNTKNYTDTVLYGVQVKNAHLVSESFLRFICTVLYGHPEQEIDSIVFDPNGKPVVDGHEVFAIFDAGTGTITINLRRHFANAVRVAEHGLMGFSIHASIWSGMVDSFLHEFKHALDVYENDGQTHRIQENQERIADQWASEAKTYFARQGKAEMSELTEEPYFGPLVTKFLKQAAERHPTEWAQEQQKMNNAGIFYRNKQAGIEIHTMEEFYVHSFQGLDQDEFGLRLNACLKRERELEEKVWNHEEMCELALKEAISSNHKVKIDHVDAEAAHFSHIMVPQQITSKNYYLWVDAVDEEIDESISIRVDLIRTIKFMS